MGNTSFYAHGGTSYSQQNPTPTPPGGSPLTSPNSAAPSSYYTQSGQVYHESATFTLVYFGSYATDPTTDPYGNPLVAGQLYFSTTLNNLKVWTGTAWVGTAVNSFNGRVGVVAPLTGDYSFAQISGVAAPTQLPAASLTAIGGVKAVNAVAHQWVASISTLGVPTLSQPAFGDISGTIAASQLPTPTATTLGGVESIAAVAHQWVNSIGLTGAPTLSQPAFGDISGTVAASQLPTPTATTLGGVESAAAVAHQWVNSISTAGVPALSQPAFTDISGTVAATQLPNPSATTLGGVESAAAVAHQWINSISTAGVPALSQPAFTDISGSVAAGQMPAFTGDVTSTAGTVATAIAAGAVTFAKLAAAAIATTAQYLANTASLLLTTDQVWAAATTQALTDATTIAVNFGAGINFSVTLGGNRTLGLPTSMKIGQTGWIAIAQDATGSRTLAYAAGWKFPGATAPTLTTTASATDILFYTVLNASTVMGVLVKNVG